MFFLKEKKYFQPKLPFNNLDDLEEQQESYEKNFFKMPIGKKKGKFAEKIMFENPIYLANLKNFIIKEKIEKFYFVAKKIDNIFYRANKIKIKEGVCEICNNEKIDYFLLTKEGKILFSCSKCSTMIRTDIIKKEVPKYSFVLNLDKYKAKEFIKKFKKSLGIKKLTSKTIYELIYKNEEEEEEED